MKNTKNETFFIGGEHSIELTLRHNKKLINYICCTNDKKAKTEGLLSKHESKIKVLVKSEKTIKSLFKDHFKHQNIVANISKKKNELANLDKCKNETVLVFEEIYDIRNIGSIIRTALGFGINDFFFNKKNSKLNNEHIYQASSGYINLANCYYYINLSRLLVDFKNQGFWISGLDSTSNQNIYDFVWPQKNVLVIGNEHSGLKALTKKNCDYLLKIPITNNIESFNVSNALAITLALKKKAPTK